MQLRRFVAALVLLLSAGAAARAQSLGDIAKKNAADKAAKAGRTAPPTKTLTNKDLRAAPGDAVPESTEPVVLDGDAKTQDALAALRAVESVLAGGANTAEFKRYYLDAKVKVDALPQTPGTAPLRAISDLYADAITLSIAATLREMGGSTVVAFKTRYATDYGFLEAFRSVPDAGFDRRSRSDFEHSAISARFAGQVLLLRAGEKLSAIKS